jgi:hypothetical protein
MLVFCAASLVLLGCLGCGVCGEVDGAYSGRAFYVPLEGPGWAANAVGGAYEIHTLGEVPVVIERVK